MEPLVFKVLLEMLVFLELMDNLEKLYVAGLMITIVNTYVYLLCVCVCRDLLDQLVQLVYLDLVEYLVVQDPKDQLVSLVSLETKVTQDLLELLEHLVLMEDL